MGRTCGPLTHCVFEFNGHLLDVVIHAVDDLALVLAIVVLTNVGDDKRGVAVISFPHESAALEASVGLLVEAHGHKDVALLREVGAVLGPLHPHASAAEAEAERAVQAAGQGQVASAGGNEVGGVRDDLDLWNRFWNTTDNPLLKQSGVGQGSLEQSPIPYTTTVLLLGLFLQQTKQKSTI